MLTKQECFDRVWDWFVRKGRRKSFDAAVEQCMYRGPKGARCAAGVLISDKAYTPAIESLNADHDAVLSALAKSGVPKDAMPIVMAMQEAHDTGAPDGRKFRGTMRSLLIDIADDYDLEHP